MNIPRHRPKPAPYGCQHRCITRATDVTAVIVVKPGAVPFLGTDETIGAMLVSIPRKYASIEFCSSPVCERVFHAQEG